jgi:hydrogenase maturation protease
MTPSVLVVGIGSEFRGDDGVGPAVVRELAGLDETALGTAPLMIRPLSEPWDLLGLWDEAALAVVVDATHSGAVSGTVTVTDLSKVVAGEALGEAAADNAGLASTHGLGVCGVLRLARALDSAPPRVVLVGVEGADFRIGAELTTEVARAIPHAVEAVLDLIGRTSPCA